MSARALDDVTSSLGYGVYDADTHYYEPYDAFTRHIDPAFRDRAVHSRPDAKGRQRPWFGDQPLRFLTVHPEDVVGAPGSLRDVFEHPNESTTGYSIRAATFPRSWSATRASRSWTSRGSRRRSCSRASA